MPSPDFDRRAKLSFGVAALCVVFGLESAVAHHTAPSAASPFVWATLAVVGLGALVHGARWAPSPYA